MIVPDNNQARKEAATIIRAGGVIAFRTDTFYGLGADPFNQHAVSRVRTLKGREDTQPILLLISDEGELDRFLASRSQTFDAIAKRLWPGPLTLIGVAVPEVPAGLTAGTKTIGVRLPVDEDVRDLVRACGSALTATSANISGQAPARTANEVEKYFPEGIDLIIDGGEVTATQPSTVLDLTEPKPRLIREGAVTRIMLADWM